jgi:hypothetical protein
MGLANPKGTPLLPRSKRSLPPTLEATPPVCHKVLYQYEDMLLIINCINVGTEAWHRVHLVLAVLPSAQSRQRLL